MQYKSRVFKIITLVFFSFGGIWSGGAFGAGPSGDETGMPLNKILDRIESRYAAAGFSAGFKQESTIQAMDITDTAFGKIFVKRPGAMRWEYEKPDRQIIITDSRSMWIYKPDDNQVMTGKAPDFFGDGKGAGFLSDMKIIRRKFDVSLEEKDKSGNYILMLIPLEPSLDLEKIFLTISKETYDVLEVVTYNTYEDQNRIIFSDIKFHKKPDPSLFRFVMPEGADIVELDE